MIRAWDVQYNWNPWLSVGFHFDHTDPSLTLHLPLLIVAFGRLKQPGFRHSLFRPLDRFGRPTTPRTMGHVVDFLGFDEADLEAARCRIRDGEYVTQAELKYRLAKALRAAHSDEDTEMDAGIGQPRTGQKVHATSRDTAPMSRCGVRLKRVTYDATLADLPEMLCCMSCARTALEADTGGRDDGHD